MHRQRFVANSPACKKITRCSAGGRRWFVSDQHDGSTLTMKQVHLVQHQGRIVGIEIPCRFIGQQNLWLIQESSGHRYALPFPDTQLPGPMIRALIESKLCDQFFGSPLRFRVGSLRRGQQHVLQHIQERQEMKDLEHKPDLRGTELSPPG